MPKRLSGTLLLAIVVVVLCPLSGTARELASISGRVQDSGGLPLVGALVIATATSPTVPQRIALTDKDGAFSIVNLLAGGSN